MDALAETTYQIADSYQFVTGTAYKQTYSLAFELITADDAGVETGYYRCDVCLN